MARSIIDRQVDDLHRHANLHRLLCPVGSRATFGELEQHAFLVNAAAFDWESELAVQKPDMTIDTTLAHHLDSSFDFTFGHLLASTSAAKTPDDSDLNLADAEIWADWTFLPSTGPENNKQSTGKGCGGGKRELVRPIRDKSGYQRLLNSLSEDVSSSDASPAGPRIQEVRARSQVRYARIRLCLTSKNLRSALSSIRSDLSPGQT